MAIPDYQLVMPALLRALAGGPKHIADLASTIADEFGLTEAERTEMLPSRSSTRIRSRVGWARTYLKAAGLVSQPARGVVELTDRGRKFLTGAPATIDNAVLRQFPEFVDFERRSRIRPVQNGQPSVEPVDAIAAQTSPEERIGSAAAEIDAALRLDLLERLKAGPADFFERVVLDVLKALGYGAGSGGMAEVIGGSGDGGIDGVIDEDRLGLDRIYVQAKRFADATVGAPVIHSFIGALHMRGATKGVLLTTSSFTRSAIEAAQKNPTMRIVLIDGERLAALMIRHGVGVRTDRTVEIRKIDLDYFEPDDA